jgi:BMFP domain-containing protein YqiC
MKDRIQDNLGRMAELFGQLSADARNNLQGISETIGQRLNLVSREEFDIQKALVEQLRQQLQQLELRLDQIESAQPAD